MSSTPALSVCFMTCDQPNAAKCFLDDFAKQASDDVEIIIKDDSSDCLTERLVLQYVKTFPVPITYVKGTKIKGRGYDLALLEATKLANGKYVWWFGDDRLADGAIFKVLDAINNYPNSPLIWLNARNIHDRLDKGLDLGGNKEFCGIDDLFLVDVGLLGFPSITITNREQMQPHLIDADKFVGTALTGFFLVLASVTNSDYKPYFIQEPLILSNPKPIGEVRWYDSFQVHAINYMKIASAFRDEICDKAFKTGMSAQFGRIWRAVVYERALGLRTGFAAPGPKVSSIMRYYWSFPEAYLAIALILLPRPVLSLIFKFKSRSSNI